MGGNHIQQTWQTLDLYLILHFCYTKHANW